MAWLAFALVATFLVVVFPVRALLRRRRFGSAAGVDFTRRRPARWYVADGGFLAGFALVVVGPLLDALDVAGSLGDGIPAVGVALGAAGFALALWTQEAMGAAWRPDIGPADGAGVVTAGPLGVVRNPTYVAMLAVTAGALLTAPTWAGAAGAAMLLAALALTARLEEAELLTKHGATYGEYTARVGRFVPGVGRIRR